MKRESILRSWSVWGWVVSICVYAVLVCMPPVVHAEDLATTFFDFLNKDLKLSKNEIGSLKKGSIITKQLDTDVKQEAAIVSVARISIPETVFVEHYGKEKLSIERAKAEKWSTFSQPPKLEDVKEMTLRSVSLEELGNCKNDKCKLKAPASLIEAFAKIDKSAADAQQQIDAALQQAIVGFAQDYLNNGRAGMIEYRDQKDPSRVADEFQDILKQSPYLNTYMPELRDYLENFPKKSLENAASEMYWMVENFGGKAKRLTISLNHMVKYQPKPDSLILASTQLYANHYYEAALGLTIMVKIPDDPEPGVYLLHINRSRIDLLRRVPRMLATDLFEGAQTLINEKMGIVKGELEKLAQAK